MTTQIDLTSLGLDPDRIEQLVVEKICHDMTTSFGVDEYGDEWPKKSSFAGAVESRVDEAVNQKIDELAQKHLIPKVSELIENITLQKTNEWGEAKGEPVTFVEYLVQRAEAYITEKVDHRGKTRSESGGFGWSPDQTRISHMIDQHLHYSIEAAMKKALGDLNKSVAKGLKETVEMKIQEVCNKLDVKVTS